MESKTDFEIICAFILLKAAIKAAEKNGEDAMISALNDVVTPFEFAFNIIKERQKPESRFWAGGVMSVSNAIVDKPPFILGGEKVLSQSDFERIYQHPYNQWGLND